MKPPAPHPIEPGDGQPTQTVMVCRLIFAAVLPGYGIWLMTYPARTAGLNQWRDCATPKGLICIPTPR
jgi:hypothetical protein